MVCAPEMLGKYYRSTNALMPLAADATRLLTACFPACVAGKRKGSIFRGSAIGRCHSPHLWAVPGRSLKIVTTWNFVHPLRGINLTIADPRILSWWTETDLRTESLHQSDAPLGLTWCS